MATLAVLDVGHFHVLLITHLPSTASSGNTSNKYHSLAKEWRLRLSAHCSATARFTNGPAQCSHSSSLGSGSPSSSSGSGPSSSSAGLWARQLSYVRQDMIFSLL